MNTIFFFYKDMKKNTFFLMEYSVPIWRYAVRSPDLKYLNFKGLEKKKEQILIFWTEVLKRV